MAVVNSEQEAENLRSLFFEYGPAKEQPGYKAETTTEWYETTGTTEWYVPTFETTPSPEPANATVHIGFHDLFIEGEYLTVRSK
jgi:hypothetical protein